MAEGVRYIKISKIDKNGVDNTNTLQSINQITIPYSTGNVVYKILNISEEPTFFTYYVENPNIEWADRADIEYDFSSSISQANVNPSLGSNNGAAVDITSITDNLNFYLETNPYTPNFGNGYRLNTYSQKGIYFNTSGSINVIDGGAQTQFHTIKLHQNADTLDSKTWKPSVDGNPYTFELSSSLSNTSPGDIFWISVGNVVASSVIQFTFSGDTFFQITSSNAVGPSIETIPEPYFDGNFARSLDCQPTLNNVISNRRGNLYQDVDYNSGISTPTNYTLILNNTALKAEVPDSNYTLTRNTRPRYEGTKNTTQKINTWTRNGSWGSNEGSYGKEPSISVDIPLIYEFEYGGGTTPEILGWGGFKMGKILNVQTADSVRDVDPSEGLKLQQQFFPFPSSLSTIAAYRKIVYNGAEVNAGVSPNNATGSAITGSGTGDNVHFWSISQSVSDYYYSLNNNLPTNTEISITQYNPNTAGSSPTSPQTSKILTTKFGIPSISNYALTSSNSYSYGILGNSGGGFGFLQLSGSSNRPISRVIKDSNGNYASGEPIRATFDTIGDEIVKSLNNNEKWFITVYNEFEFIGNKGTYDNALTTGSLSPMNNGYNTLDGNGDYLNPLAYKGVYEIIGTRTDFTPNPDLQQFILSTPIYKPDGITLAGASEYQVGDGGLGILIWKAQSSNKSEYVLLQDSLNGTGKGCFVNKFTTQIIKNNLLNITKEFGSNKV